MENLLRLLSKKAIAFSLIVLTLLSLTGCGADGQQQKISKLNENDPFKKSIVASEIFEIKGNEDNTIEGKNGTVVVLPKGCFKNSKGKVVEKNIKVELAEALSMEDMVLSNLTTSADGKLLESAGMLFINATSDGEQLSVDPENPIYIEMPKQTSLKDMQVYTGVRDEKGNMNWINPEPLPVYLIPVDMSTLNFFPEGFESTVDAGMPFRSYKVATPELKDSLYYSLTQYGAIGEEPYGRIQNTEIIKLTQYSESPKPEGGRDSSLACGIDPAAIKVLKSKKFENTFISTREFEKRLQAIFQTCDNSILEIYVNNLDKDLWTLDEAVVNKLGENKMSPVFNAFAEEKLTNVRAAEKKAMLLKAYYAKQLQKVKAELSKVKKKASEQLQKDNEKAEKIREEYDELLVKREKYRLEKFGFERKELGWVNVDKVIDELETFELVVEVTNGKEFDRVHTYIVNPVIKSLFAMTSEDKTIFDRGYNKDPHLLMWKEQEAQAVVIAYKGDVPFLVIKDFSVRKVNHLKLEPFQTTEKEVKEMLKEFNKGYKKVNKIELDLKFQESFEKEKKRQERLIAEALFIEELRKKAFPCCAVADSSFAK
jgi:hypothetical protein